jgi:two-component system, LytTR family, response regulator AlgR
MDETSAPPLQPPLPAPATPALRLLIVDDEPLARLRLRQLVEETAEPAATVVDEADSAAALEQALRRHLGPNGESELDALLLDIGLPGPSGLAIAATLRALPHPPALVFVTAHAEHALQAFELEAIDYLTKPVRRERLQQALVRVLQWRRGDPSSTLSAFGGLGPAVMPGGPGAPGAVPGTAAVLVLNERGRVLRLPHAEILSLRAEHKTVLVRTASAAGPYVVDESLNELEQRLGEGFLRIHRNALVAIHAIRELELRSGLEDDGGGDGWAVRIAGAQAGAAGEWLAVSRRQVASVKSALAKEG